MAKSDTKYKVGDLVKIDHPHYKAIDYITNIVTITYPNNTFAYKFYNNNSYFYEKYIVTIIRSKAGTILFQPNLPHSIKGILCGS